MKSSAALERVRREWGRRIEAEYRSAAALTRSSAPLEIDLLHHGVRLYCLGETVAVRLFSTMRQGAEQPQAREALDRILRDEVVHRDFGWTFLEWMLESAEAPRYRSHLAQTLPSMLKAIREGYGGDETGAPRADAALSPEARRWGLISRAEYTAAVASTFERDYSPLFASLGVALNGG